MWVIRLSVGSKKEKYFPSPREYFTITADEHYSLNDKIPSHLLSNLEGVFIDG
jgi:hypothetical protein